MKKNARKKSAHRFREVRRVILFGLLVIMLSSSIIIASHITTERAGNIQSNPSSNTLVNSSAALNTLITVIEKESVFISVPAESIVDTGVSSETITAVTAAASSALKETTPPAHSTAISTAENMTESKKVSEGETPDLTGYIVVLDPGHQLHANYELEALGPNMSGTKAKCSSGTSGVSTGRPEYEVNLEIALKMRDYLQSLGCQVYMTRTSNDVNISNIERANIALSYSPDVYIRLHCDGSSNASSRGAAVFVADTGKYADSLTDWGDLLGECMAASTGAKYRGCYSGSTYSGLNWAVDIPSFLFEMGFMTNIQEDELLSSPDYQQKICEGVAAFIFQMPRT